MMRINIEVTEGSRLKQIHEIQVLNLGIVELLPDFDLEEFLPGPGALRSWYKVALDGVDKSEILHDRGQGALVLAGLAIEEVLGG